MEVDALLADPWLKLPQDVYFQCCHEALIAKIIFFLSMNVSLSKSYKIFHLKWPSVEKRPPSLRR